MYQYDIHDSMDSARGVNPPDTSGNEKAQAIQIAAQLYSIYPRIAASCDSVLTLVELLRVDEISEMLNTLVNSFLYSDIDGGALFRLYRSMSDIIAKTFLDTHDDSTRKERLSRYEKEPITVYLLNYLRDAALEGMTPCLVQQPDDDS